MAKAVANTAVTGQANIGSFIFIQQVDLEDKNVSLSAVRCFSGLQKINSSTSTATPDKGAAVMTPAVFNTSNTDILSFSAPTPK